MERGFEVVVVVFSLFLVGCLGFVVVVVLFGGRGLSIYFEGREEISRV